jgi:dTDP-4-dehydrorhamnose reductase
LIVITGGSGLLGANLALQWSLQNLDVAALYFEHSVSMHGVHALACNLLDQREIAGAISTLRPEWIVHCAAATNVDWCEANPRQTHRLNVEASRHLAASAKAVGARFVYISTDSVFDGARGSYGESDRPAPVNAYARSKLSGESAVKEQLPGSLIVRTNIYGWNLQPKTSLAEWILTLLEKSTAVPAFQDVVFSPILVNDLADALLEMMRMKLEGTFHVGGSEPCSKREFALQLAEVFQLNHSLVHPRSIYESSLQVPRPLDTSLNTTKAENALGHALPQLRAGLERFKEIRQNGFAARLKAAGAAERTMASCPGS